VFCGNQNNFFFCLPTTTPRENRVEWKKEAIARDFFYLKSFKSCFVLKENYSRNIPQLMILDTKTGRSSVDGT
jgi:hypothetical protein